MFANHKSVDFDIDLAKIWSWLHIQYKKKGTCDYGSLEMDNVSPLHSQIAQCHLDSFSEGEYKTIKQTIKSIYE